MNFGLADGNAKITDGESPAYNEIHAFVEKSFSESPAAIQGLVFCVAYALYSKRKKDMGTRLSKEGKPGEDIARTLQAILANEATYKEVVQEANQHIAALTDETSKKVLEKIGAEIVDGIDERINHTGKPAHIRFWYFLKHSAVHGLHIVVAALIIYALAQSILVIGPQVGIFLDSVGLKYLGDLLKDIAR